MITVLHLRSGSSLYGADRALLALATATRPPFRVIVGALGPDEGSALADAAHARGLDAQRFTFDRRVDLACARRIARFIHWANVDLVHAHDFKSLALGLRAARREGVPVVATFHGDTAADLKLRMYEAFARLMGNRTQGVIAPSRALQQRLSRWVKTAPVELIHNALDDVPPPTESEKRTARLALKLDANAPVLACLGRLSPEKGHRVLLQALSKMKQPPITLIAGDGPLHDSLARDAGQLPVRFLGFVADSRQVYAAADVVVMPSLREASPLVALEAGLHRRPLVATRVGDLDELFANEAGALVPPGNVDGLLRELEHLFSDPKLRELRASRLHERVHARHGAQAMASAYARVYARAIGTRESLAPDLALHRETRDAVG